MQREIRKRKADSISRSAAEVHSFACVEDLSQRAGDRLLTIATNVNGFFAYLLNLYETLRIFEILRKLMCCHILHGCVIQVGVLSESVTFAAELRSLVDSIQNSSQP